MQRSQPILIAIIITVTKVTPVIRSILINIFFYLITSFFAIVLVFTFFLPRSVFFAGARGWSSSLLWMLSLFGMKHEFRGLENLPVGTPYILAPKHQSAWDVFAFFQLIPEPAIVIKKELVLIPFFGWCLIKAGCIQLDRSSGAAALKSLLKGAKKNIDAGHSLLIFPEGTRRGIDDPPDYKYGITFLYNSLKVPVVPVALNSGVFWGRRSFTRKKGTIIVDILPAIMPGLEKTVFANTLSNQIEEATQRLLKEKS
jgi:1-acyl-sn-glycerol-3-phosphate acyltransferase